MIITKETTKITLDSLKGLWRIRKRSFLNQRKAYLSGFKLTNDKIYIAFELWCMRTAWWYCLMSLFFLFLYNNSKTLPFELVYMEAYVSFAVIGQKKKKFRCDA